MLSTKRRKSATTPAADLFLKLLVDLFFWLNLLPTVYLWIIADDLMTKDIRQLFRNAGIAHWNVEITDDIYITVAVKKKDETRARQTLERRNIVVM